MSALGRNGLTHRCHMETAQNTRARNPDTVFILPEKNSADERPSGRAPYFIRVETIRLAQLFAWRTRGRDGEIGPLRENQGKPGRGECERGYRDTDRKGGGSDAGRTPSGKKRHLVRYVSARWGFVSSRCAEKRGRRERFSSNERRGGGKCYLEMSAKTACSLSSAFGQ